MNESPFTSSGLVRDLADYILLRTDTNPSFAETCAAALVATACGPDVIISDVKGDVNFNIFGIVVGGSSISNKTVALDIVREIIRLLSTELETDLDLPQKFSIEGLSKYLIKKSEGMIAGDEYSAMFQQAASKTWLRESMEFLSTLYDGYIPKYVTIARGTEYVKDIYVNFLSATTFYFLRLMKTDDFFLQGTGNRFLWDVDFTREELEEDPIAASMFFLTSDARKEREKELAGFVQRLAELRRAMNRVVDHAFGADFKYVLNLDMEALSLLGMYRIQKINQATRLFQENILNPDSGYLARLTENAIKLAGIHCVGRIYEDYPFEAPEIIKEDVEWAIQKVDHHFEMYLKLKEIRDQLHADYSTRSHMTDFQKVLSEIEAKGGRANFTQILQRTGWLKENALPIIDAMRAAELIEVREVKPSGSKRHGVFIKFGTKIPWVEKNAVEPREPIKPICSACGKEIEGVPNIRGNQFVCQECVG